MARVFSEIANAMDCETPLDAIEKFSEMMAEMDLKNPVSTNWAEELAALSTSVNPVRLKNNPVKLDEDTIASLYELIISHPFIAE